VEEYAAGGDVTGDEETDFGSELPIDERNYLEIEFLE